MKKIALYLFIIMNLAMCKVEAAAISICFSYDSLTFSEKKINVKKERLLNAIQENDESAIIFYMRSEISYLKGNHYALDTREYKLKEQAIFWDAVMGNNLKLVKRYVDLGVELNQLYPVDTLLSPLMIASRCGYVEMVKMLIKAGADINMKGAIVSINNTYIYDVTALSQAQKMEYIEIEELLLEAGAIKIK
ncbi:ankyrin repeat domain-containing protein [Pseudoalteromonas rubra]|uniref:Uncharacterized protein n=1 Tax=Pseudoalteromonas rubra TaxID=43658 RepID=A0A0U3GUH8_9GAMM|nr:ankyrin repeat domain-containing protein [Pseudoalteromonas rubra]ALU42819.1 hypothetical protein AT705_07555 [Pseudoalteromonas rubra]